MEIKIEEVAAPLPPLSRGKGKRTSPEGLKYQEALKLKKHCQIQGIKEKREFDAVQQRIRSAANAINMKVAIRKTVTADSFTLSFMGYEEGEDLTALNGSKATEAKGKTAATKK